MRWRCLFKLLCVCASVCVASCGFSERLKCAEKFQQLLETSWSGWYSASSRCRSSQWKPEGTQKLGRYEQKPTELSLQYDLPTIKYKQCTFVLELQQHVFKMFSTNCLFRIQSPGPGFGEIVEEEPVSVGYFKQRFSHLQSCVVGNCQVVYCKLHCNCETCIHADLPSAVQAVTPAWR